MIYVDVSQQVLHHGLKSYPISTAKLGLGSEENSFKTPLGSHIVTEIIGLDQPIYTHFMARKPVGICLPNAWPSIMDQDLILSRIIRLQGTEPGMNQGPGIDSFSRMIYIHGTNAERHIGSPASKGCIRMLNQDMISLCANIRIGYHVHIKERL